MQGQAGHVLPENNFIGRSRIVKICHRLVRVLNHGTRVPGGFEVATQIGVFELKHIDHPVDHHLWHLGSSRIVEIDPCIACVAERQGRELSTDGVDIKGRVQICILFKPTIACGSACLNSRIRAPSCRMMQGFVEHSDLSSPLMLGVLR